MMEIHAFDAWLKPDLHKGDFFRFARFLGGFPAPAFLFMAGFALALAVQGAEDAGRSRWVGTRHIAGRAAIILLGAYAFRFFAARSWNMTFYQCLENALGHTDVLNCIGVGLFLAAPMVAMAKRPSVVAGLSVACAATFSWLTPAALGWHQPAWFPHTLWLYIQGAPPDAYFPLFPWAGFVFVGAAAGAFAAASRGDGIRESRINVGLFLAGALVFIGAVALDASPWTLFPGIDFWHESPCYFAVRAGYLLVFCAAFWKIDRLFATRTALWPARALVALGRHSLLIYWVHIELVYGKTGLDQREQLSIAQALPLYGALIAAMTLLALAQAPLRNAAKSVWARIAAPRMMPSL